MEETTVLLNEEKLAWSPVAANNAMNRERKVTGINSYEKDIKFNPIEFISNRKGQNSIAWIDLCCGQGNALIETAQYFKDKKWADKIKLTGIDLVNYFSDKQGLTNLELEVLNLYKWQPTTEYDLITIVHGLHYVGNKIDLIIKSATALKQNGVFIANLDIKDIQIKGVVDSQKTIKSFFKKEGIVYNAKTKIIKIESPKTIENPFIYCGSNDKIGKNYTGQNVVSSVYE